MVVGPSQCGKTCFVFQLLTHKRFAFPDKKPRMVYWFYNQWQPIYDEMQRVLQKKIRFAQGIPELSDELHELRPTHNHILVFDDLMTQAKDSPVISKLFTQGRHRQASVILLLQNMFPKGKYNTDISRNATYKVLFRSPGDRKQIDIMAEQTFAKDRPRFMNAYHQETHQPFGYILVDNHPRTTGNRQVLANVFDDCYTYPCITSSLRMDEGPSVSPSNSPSPLREPQRETSRNQNAKKVTVSRQGTKKRVQRSVKIAPKRPKVQSTGKTTQKRQRGQPLMKKRQRVRESSEEDYSEEEEEASTEETWDRDRLQPIAVPSDEEDESMLLCERSYSF